MNKRNGVGHAMPLQLNPGERSILATFHQFPRAEACQAALQEAGFTTIQLDRIGKGGFNPTPGTFAPYPGRTTTLAGVTYLDSPAEIGGMDTRPLYAAMPEASGMAGELTARGHGVLLTAVVPAGRVAEALRIIRAHGGET